MEPTGHLMRFCFAKWNCDRLKEDADLAKNIIISDETHFYLGGYVIKQNCRIWSTENPYAYIKKPKHPERVTVWCGFWFRGIIKPFFSENEQEVNVTVDGDIWYQQDSATWHTIALSASELMYFGQLRDVIWHRWFFEIKQANKWLGSTQNWLSYA